MKLPTPEQFGKINEIVAKHWHAQAYREWINLGMWTNEARRHRAAIKRAVWKELQTFALQCSIPERDLLELYTAAEDTWISIQPN